MMATGDDSGSLSDILKQAVVDHLCSVHGAAVAAHCTVVIGKWKSGDADASVILSTPLCSDDSPPHTQQHAVITDILVTS